MNTTTTSLHFPSQSFDEYLRNGGYRPENYEFSGASIGAEQRQQSAAGFKSRFAAQRSIGQPAIPLPGATGTTSHCYLHPLMPEYCAPYFICVKSVFIHLKPKLFAN
jgi:hypothetical protein